jgi:hypothetical protein
MTPAMIEALKIAANESRALVDFDAELQRLGEGVAP